MKTVEIEIPIGYGIDKEKSTFEKIEVKNEWVDLGLPSGNLWKSINEDGYFTYNDAVKKFEDNLPTIVDFAELAHYCKWKWLKLKGMVVTGPNKNQIFFPAVGCRNINSKTLFNVGSYGYYWSISPHLNNGDYAYSLIFHFGNVNPVLSNDRGFGQSVRCVKHK